ncbi:hypothetical protein PJ912_16715 [Pectobacterium colocasium]|uniref:Uncharacterized protein n=1 Tax=Pectobacterium carotovorum TaxID=554 RepID=A0A419AYT5_PECCA|nr:hypothetical protein [Pectobacterium carotovorum]RJL53165.1 hypothetical protein D5071_05820 [Pectobacterium carotovorum]WED67916.1 hypothetical protein PJ912_16715 [Pectobacterium colocasium]
MTVLKKASSTINMIRNLAERNSVVASEDVLRVFAALEQAEKRQVELEKQRDALVAELKDTSLSHSEIIAENVQQVSLLQKILSGRPGGVYFNKYETEIEKVLGENVSTEKAIRELMAKGIYFSSNRLLAAFDAGFINKPLKEVADVATMILSAVDELPNATPGDFKREFSDEILATILNVES